MHYLKARGSTLRVLAMNLLPVIIAAVAANQLSLLFRNIDDENKMAVYFKNDEGMEKLESVLQPEGSGQSGSDDANRYPERNL